MFVELWHVMNADAEESYDSYAQTHTVKQTLMSGLHTISAG